MRISLGKAAKGLVAGGIAAVLASGAVAATDGLVGFTSTGTLDITIQVDDEVRISALQDIDLGTFAGVDASGSSTACIYRNTAPTYQITGTGSGAANAFTLTNGIDTVDYSVSYTTSGAAQSLTSGVALTGQTGADQTSTTCGGTGNNGTVGVTVAAADAAALPAGTYNGTLTLVVAPN